MTEKQKFHFSGICGAGMGNAALLVSQMGHRVKGSDKQFYPPMSTRLQNSEIQLIEGFSEENLRLHYKPDVQVVANALSKDHCEVKAGERGDWQKMSFPEVLEKVVLPGKIPVVVAGTHGKTTTTSLLMKMLEPLGGGYFIGGIMQDGSPGCHLGREGAPFVIEGDEYDTAWFDKNSKFLHYRPQHVILTHLEWDHVDIFPDFEDMKKQFRALLDLVPESGWVIYCGDAEHLRELLKDYQGLKLSYGYGAGNDVRLQDSDGLSGELRFFLEDGSEHLLETPMLGRIYHLNTIGAALMALKMGRQLEEVQEQIRDFTGAKRRLELLRSEPYLLYSDFAHHPTSVEQTITILKKKYPGRQLWAMFDPRNASSRRNIFEDHFVRAFSGADRVTIGPTPEDKRLSTNVKLDPVLLAEKIGSHAKGCATEDSLRQEIASGLEPGQVILIMSCGGFFGLIEELEKGDFEYSAP